MTECDGRTALGPCDKQAKYLVRAGSRQHTVVLAACGIHLAQLVKRQLKRPGSVVEVHDV